MEIRFLKSWLLSTGCFEVTYQALDLILLKRSGSLVRPSLLTAWDYGSRKSKWRVSNHPQSLSVHQLASCHRLPLLDRVQKAGLQRGTLHPARIAGSTRWPQPRVATSLELDSE